MVRLYRSTRWRRIGIVLSTGSCSPKQPSTAKARTSGGSSNATFAQDAQQGAPWKAFLKKDWLGGLALSDVIAAPGRVLVPVVEAAAASNSPLHRPRKSGGPRSREERV